MDGFYNDMIFHRIVNNFMIQTGALRHTSSKAVAVPLSSPDAADYRKAVQAQTALDRRQYELNSRIRFNHRGQVAMALGAKDTGNDVDDIEDVQPQFFVTLEDAEYLNNKHVVFGTIGAGPTIFNALRIGRTETDASTHQPVDLENATRILSVKIVENPLHGDLVPQSKVPWARINPAKESTDGTSSKKKKKRKGKLDKNVLSFGAELEEEEEGDMSSSTNHDKTGHAKGMQSSHDVVESKVLKKEVDNSLKDRLQRDNLMDSNSDQEMSKKKKRLDDDETRNRESSLQSAPAPAESTVSHSFSTRKDRQESNQAGSLTWAESIQKPALTEQDASKKSGDKKMSAVEARRMKYTKGKKSKKSREEDTLAKLNAFRSTVQMTVEERKASTLSQHDKKADDSLAARMARKAQAANNIRVDKNVDQAPAYNGQVLESDDENGDGSSVVNGSAKRQKWLGTTFRCRRHMDQDAGGKELGGDGRAADDYEVVDMKGGIYRHHHRHSHHKQDKKKHKHEHHRDR